MSNIIQAFINIANNPIIELVDHSNSSLNEKNKDLLTYIGYDHDLSINYHAGNVIRIDMNEWYKENCK